MISILIESWDKVDQSDKDQLWLNIKNYWHIPNDYHKREVVADCCTQWRQYKSRLLYLRDIGENPLLEYIFLDEKMYRDFVVLKSTKQFQEKRRKGKELVKMNKNPARLGKSGYHGKEAERAKQVEAGVTIKGHHISSERTRHFLFARRKRDSSVALRLPLAIEPLANEFIEKDIQASQGVLEIGPRFDLLIEVLGPEHSGRTRAIGHNIGPTKLGIYDRRRKKYESQDTEASMSDNMYEKLKTRQMADMVDDIVSMAVAALKKDGTNVRSKTTTTVLDELHKMTEHAQCKLMLPYGTIRPALVKGTVFPFEDGLIHSIPLEVGYVRVSLCGVHDHLHKTFYNNLGNFFYSLYYVNGKSCGIYVSHTIN